MSSLCGDGECLLTEREDGQTFCFGQREYQEDSVMCLTDMAETEHNGLCSGACKASCWFEGTETSRAVRRSAELAPFVSTNWHNPGHVYEKARIRGGFCWQ